MNIIAKENKAISGITLIFDVKNITHFLALFPCCIWKTFLNTSCDWIAICFKAVACIIPNTDINLCPPSQGGICLLYPWKFTIKPLDIVHSYSFTSPAGSFSSHYRAEVNNPF